MHGVEKFVDKVEKYWGRKVERVWKKRWKMCITFGSPNYGCGYVKQKAGVQQTEERRKKRNVFVQKPIFFD